MPPAPRTRAVSFAWILLAYLAAAATAALVARLLPGAPAWKVVALADAAATLVVFGFSVLLRNSSTYDPYWSVAPMLIAPALALGWHGATDGSALRRYLVVALVLLWGARLTYNWARGWQGLHHEDWRYVDIHAKTGRAYWPVSFLGIHLVPTLSVYLGCLSLLPSLTSAGARPLNALDALAFAVTLGAIALEATADEQLRAFRVASPQPGQILQTGLWALSRHPNYLGEISFWWGLFLFGLAAHPGWWWTVAGPLWITALFVFISIPLMDKHALARRPEYARHMKRLPALVPSLFGPRRSTDA